MRIKKEVLESLGEVLHMALRKLCDNKQTSIAYNLIHEIDSEVWKCYVLFLTMKIKDMKFVSDEYISIVIAEHTVLFFNGEWRDELGDKRSDEEYRKKFRTGIVKSLSCAFELFSKQDWRNYCGYIIE